MTTTGLGHRLDRREAETPADANPITVYLPHNGREPMPHRVRGQNGGVVLPAEDFAHLSDKDRNR